MILSVVLSIISGFVAVVRSVLVSFVTTELVSRARCGLETVFTPKCLIDNNIYSTPSYVLCMYIGV